MSVPKLETDEEFYCRLFSRMHGEAVIRGTLARTLPHRREEFRNELATDIWNGLEEIRGMLWRGCSETK